MYGQTPFLLPFIRTKGISTFRVKSILFPIAHEWTIRLSQGRNEALFQPMTAAILTHIGIIFDKRSHVQFQIWVQLLYKALKIPPPRCSKHWRNRSLLSIMPALPTMFVKRTISDVYYNEHVKITVIYIYMVVVDINTIVWLTSESMVFSNFRSLEV